MRVTWWHAFAAVLAVFAVSVTSAATASADVCRATENMGEGNYNANTCAAGNLGALGNWILSRLLYFSAGNKWCAETLEKTTEYLNKWATPFCNTQTNPVDRGAFAKVIFNPGAAPLIVTLVEETVPVAFTGTSGKGTFETVAGTKVSCTKGTSKGSMETPTEGIAELAFVSCTSGGLSCNTVGAGKGEIKISGTTLLVFDSLSPLGAALLLNVTETAYECPSLLLKATIKGTMLLLVTPINKEETSFEIPVKESKGTPTDNKYWTEEKERKPSLLFSINGGAFEGAAAEWPETKVTFAHMIEFVG
jgi:hypothetical protein